METPRRVHLRVGVRWCAKESTTGDRRTDEMPALFNDPSGGTVESMVVSRGEVDDAEEKGISGLDAGSRSASAAIQSRARPHFSRDFDRVKHALSKVL